MNKFDMKFFQSFNASDAMDIEYCVYRCSYRGQHLPFKVTKGNRIFCLNTDRNSIRKGRSGSRYLKSEESLKCLNCKLVYAWDCKRDGIPWGGGVRISSNGCYRFDDILGSKNDIEVYTTSRKGFLVRVSLPAGPSPSTSRCKCPQSTAFVRSFSPSLKT